MAPSDRAGLLQTLAVSGTIRSLVWPDGPPFIAMDCPIAARRRPQGFPVPAGWTKPPAGRSLYASVLARSAMPLHIVRLGSPRLPGEGLRLGTVRRPPRGVPKSAFASQDWYDLWFPNLAPSAETLKLGQDAATPADWAVFARRYRAEMDEPAARHDLALLAALSHRTALSVGCYCADESRCHRGLLRGLLAEAGADIAG